MKCDVCQRETPTSSLRPVCLKCTHSSSPQSAGSVPRSLMVDIDSLLGALVHRHGSKMAEIGEADECIRLLAKVKAYSR